MRGLNRFLGGLLGIPFIGLLGLLLNTSPVSAASVYDNVVFKGETLNAQRYGCSPGGMETGISVDELGSIGVYVNDNDKAPGEYEHYVIFTRTGSGGNFTTIVAWSGDYRLEFVEPNNPNLILNTLMADEVSQWTLWRDCLDNDDKLVWNFDNNTPQQSQRIASNGGFYGTQGINASKNLELTKIPEGYDPVNEFPGELGITSDWTPDIKLHMGSDWIVELSDYNFFTFDRVAFTCRPDELAPIIKWRIYDITDDDEGEFIDEMLYGAPALVKFTAEKIQENRRYRITAQYDGCDGKTFSGVSSKEFTIRKDGSLRPTDFMTVCIMDELPYINISGCIAEINDMFAALTFRTPKADEMGGGGWTTLVNGCRELQVLDNWIMTPNITVCPAIPAHVRSVITPIVTFALALGVVTFVANRQGIRGLG